MVASRQEVATIPSRAPARTCPIIRPKNHNPVAHLPILWRHGDVVELAGPDGTVCARGVVSFDADDIATMAGKSTDDLPSDLSRPVIHADQLVRT